MYIHKHIQVRVCVYMHKFAYAFHTYTFTDLQAAMIARTLQVHTGRVNSVFIFFNSQRIASGSNDKTINTRTCQVTSTIRDHDPSCQVCGCEQGWNQACQWRH